MRYYFDKPRPRKAPGAVIKRILVRCPTTSKLLATGKEVDEQLWPVTKLEVSRLACPHCHEMHSWTKKDVVLAR